MEASVVCMSWDVRRELCHGFIIVDKLLLLTVVLHCLCDAVVAAAAQRAVATTCHRVESAPKQKKQSVIMSHLSAPVV